MNCLFIDDEILLIKPLKRVLDAKGWRVYIANSVDQAREYIKQRKIDLIVSDLRMPGECAVKFGNHLKRQNPLNPLYFIATGFSNTPPKNLYHSGFEAVLIKPVDPEDIWKRYERIKRRIVKSTGIPVHGKEHIVTGRGGMLGRGGITFTLNDSAFEVLEMDGLIEFGVNLKEAPILFSGRGWIRWMCQTSNQVGIEIGEILNEKSLEFFNKSSLQNRVIYIPSGI